jgi:hypothetical protein
MVVLMPVRKEELHRRGLLWDTLGKPAGRTRRSDPMKKDNGTRSDQRALRPSDQGPAAWRLAWMVVGALFFFVMAYGLNWA